MPAHRLQRTFVALITAASLGLLPALAAPGGKPGQAQKNEGDSKPEGQEDVDTEHLFGFSEGADAGEKGQQEVVVDTVGRIGKRRADSGPSTYRAFSTRIGYQFNPIDRLSIEFSAFGDVRRVRNIMDLDDKSFGTFDGVSIDVKYQVLKGSAEQPLGLALEVRPRFARILPIEGNAANIFDMETLIEADVQIVPKKLWYATNINFEPAAGRQRGSREGYRSSTLLWSNAVVGEVAEKTYLGPEVRYLRGYDGIFLNQLESEAVTIGPAFHHRFTEKAWVTLAYAAQVWGRDTDPGVARRSYGLNQFERHNLRLKFGMEF